MRYCAVAGAILVSTAAPAWADDGQSAFKAQLEGMRAPVFTSGKAIPGVTASYSVRNEGCTSVVDIMIPSAMFEGTTHRSSVTTETIRWGSVTSAEVSGNYLVLRAPGLVENGKRNLFAANPEGARTMKATVDRLIGACGGRTVSEGAPVAGARFAERVAIAPDAFGRPKCTFPAVPGLTLTQRKGYMFPIASFSISAWDGGAEANFNFAVEEVTERRPGWNGVNPYALNFRLRFEPERKSRLVGVEVTIDGAPSLPITAELHDDPNNPWGLLANLRPRDIEDEDKWLAQLERAEKMVIILHDAQDQYHGPWTFDVSSVRNVPAALKGSGFRCEGS